MFIINHLMIAFAIAFVALFAVGSGATTCNGHSELCDRKYSNVTFIGTHDSPFVGDDMSDNQNISLTEQLVMGVRFFQAQTRADGYTIKLCHTQCFLRDAGPLDDLLTPVKDFLQSNPTEVITLLLTNPAGFENWEFNAVFRRVGLLDYVFEPVGTVLWLKSWPTLGEMIAKNQRLVVFIGSSTCTEAP